MKVGSVEEAIHETTRTNTKLLLVAFRGISWIVFDCAYPMLNLNLGGLSAVFVWYSYVGENSDRGSLMVYLSDDGRGSAWYASFTKNTSWHVGNLKGISKREFTELMVPSTIDGI